MTLTKDLTNLTHSIGFVWLLLLLQMIHLLVRRQWRFALLPAALAGLVWLIGATQMPYTLIATLEIPHALTSRDDVPAGDAVVMLGGGHEVSHYDAFGVGVTSAFDRPVTALELMRRKRAPVLVLGGGGFLEGGKPTPDAVLLERWFTAWQIPAAPVLNLGINGDTHDEAMKLKALAQEKKWTRILLVTSANHMTRALATFRATGVEVVPVACDFRSIGGIAATKAQGFVPTHDGFVVLDAFLHESIGWSGYRWRGWLDPSPPPTESPARATNAVEVVPPPPPSKPPVEREPPGATNAPALPRTVN